MPGIEYRFLGRPVCSQDNGPTARIYDCKWWGIGWGAGGSVALLSFELQNGKLRIGKF